MRTTIVNLSDEREVNVLEVDEGLWGYIDFVAFYDYVIEIRMNNEVTHNFFKYEIYKEMEEQGKSEEYKQQIYEVEKCEYRFSKDSGEFIEWLYTEAKERELLLF